MEPGTVAHFGDPSNREAEQEVDLDLDRIARDACLLYEGSQRFNNKVTKNG